MIHLLGEKALSKKAIKKLGQTSVMCGCEDGRLLLVKEEREISLGSAINALTSTDEGIWVGCQSGEVRSVTGSGEYSTLYKHASNVCTIDNNNDYVLSGSWDHEAILYRKATSDNGKISKDENIKKRNFTHPGTVWSVKLNANSGFVTGCADGKLRMFSLDKMEREIEFHRSAIRGLLYEDTVIYSIENHGRIHKTTVSGKLLRARTLGQFVYCVGRYGKYIAVGGEDGCLYLLNEDLELLCKKQVKCDSIWDVKAVDGILYAAGSNGTLYSFTDDVDKVSGISFNDHSVSETCSEHGEMSGSREEEQDGTAESPEKRSKLNDGIFVSGGIRYKVEADKVYVENSNGWELIGDAAKKYDHSIPVELGSTRYTLNFNNGDNAHAIAKDFLHENKLDLQYHDEIVSYIHKNFKDTVAYKEYKSIEVSGIQRLIGDHPIVPVLEYIRDGGAIASIREEAGADRIEKYSVYDIEDLLFTKKDSAAIAIKEDVPLFAVLDILKFMVGNKIPIDLSLLFSIQITQKKEAKAFALLMTNIVARPVFEMTQLDKKLKQLVDCRLITSPDIHYYEENKKVSNK